VSRFSSNRESWPPVLPGFDHVTRMWDSAQNLCVTKILPGEYYVTCQEEIITTVLGSCVSACIRDPLSGVGGMNHFMLPGNTGRQMDKWGGNSCLETRYGIAAMENLINDILKQGARKDRLELKLFGGGRVLDMDVNNVGERNIRFVRQFTEAEGLRSVAEDLGDRYPRKVNYFPKTGKVMVRRLRALQKQAIVTQEKNYSVDLTKSDKPGAIDLFD
jgi:chemotaxis protein CheD